MTSQPIPFDFFRQHFEPAWADIAFGLYEGFIAPQEVIDFAAAQVDATSGSELVELAGLNRNEIYRTKDLVQKISATCDQTQTEAAKQRWLYVTLDFLRKHRRPDADLADEVETVYREFDYPGAMGHLIRYMPRQTNPFTGTPDPIFSDPAKYAKTVETFVADGIRKLSRATHRK